nr:rab effector Noc2 isoform X2 [Parasteatoda tepidariorum]
MAAAVDGIKRWICPTDRELSLRAKLNAGWSIHSQDYFHKPEPILECELRAIENVILRAKEIDITDKDRIRKMICKLENMRRNSVGDGKTTCSMCGVTFGWLRSSSIQCSDCSMAVCEKCRIDIHSAFEESILCKICSEQRELWKKSGGWFYGALPHVENLNCEDLKCYQQGGSETWEHRARDIVRLESFEAPEQTGSKMFYKTWAINSSPDPT